MYCANTSCAKFLDPYNHITDANSNIVYALCESEDCGTITCIGCRSMLKDGIENHTCEVQENDKKFKETADEEGYQECFVCGRTVELAEACNHITCECGHSFCYVCGRDWNGTHGCPSYGPAEYDEEGYNQAGYHKKTGLNRDGRTFREQITFEQEGESDETGDDDGEENEGPDWEILQHVEPDRREFINTLDPRTREDALMMLQIELLEQGITFEQPQPNNNNNNPDAEGDDEESEDDESDEENEENAEEDGNEEVGDALEDGPDHAMDAIANNDVYAQGPSQIDNVPQIPVNENNQAAEDESIEDIGDDPIEGRPAGQYADDAIHRLSSSNLAAVEDDHMTGSDDGSNIVPFSSHRETSDAASNDDQPVTPSSDSVTASDIAGDTKGQVQMDDVIMTNRPTFGPTTGWDDVGEL